MPRDLPPDSAPPWRTLETRELSANPRLVRDLVEGHTGARFEYVYRPRGSRAALIVPITDAGELVVVRQFRYPLRATLLEVPAGGVEAGEDPLDAAKRELLEEVGGTAREFVALPLFCPQPSFTGQIFHPFVALGVTLGPASPEEGELLSVERRPIREVYALLDAGEVPNGPSALTLFHARRVLVSLGLL